MLSDILRRRFVRTSSLSVAVLGASAAAALAVTHPSAAQATITALVTAVTCGSSSACVSGTNTGTGPGVAGSSSKGIGVTGTGKAASGMKGTSTSLYGVHGVSTTSYGVLGESADGGAGVVGTTPARYGVYGYTSGNSGGYGVVGSSSNGYGIFGSTTTGSGTGVAGYESGSGTGAYGFSNSGYGLEGLTETGYALVAAAYSTGNGAYISAGKGYGLVSYSGGQPAVYARNSAGNGGDVGGTYIGLVARAPGTTTGYPLVATDNNSKDLFYVNGVGDVYALNGFHAFARTAGGAVAVSYSPQATSPTIEDTGTAQLVAGTAVVRLDPTFAAAIDLGTAYRVFLTPNGDTRGLFVASKAANGFIVRESQAGHATLSFDYRVVATALGKSGQRMAVTPSVANAIEPQASLPAAPVTNPVRPTPAPHP